MAQNSQNQRKKNTGAAKDKAKKARNTKKSPQKEKYVLTEKDLKIKSEVKLLLALGVTLLLMMSNFNMLSPVGDYISYFMFGMFGLTGYFFPVLLFLAIAFFLANKKNTRAMIKLGAAVFCYLCILGILHLIFMAEKTGKSIFYFYFLCGEQKTGGGFFGAALGGGISGLIGITGTYLLLLVFLLISFVIITEKSVVGTVRQGSRTVYETAKNDMGRFRENVREISQEKEYQKNRRIHNVARGVNLEGIRDPKRMPEDMRELDEAFLKDEEEIEAPEVIHTPSPAVRKKVQKPDIMEQTRLAEMPGKEKLMPHEGFERAQEKREKQEEQFMESMEDRKETVRENRLLPQRSIVKSVEDVPKMGQTVYRDEEGNFHQTEEIVASESAKRVMNRPAFSTGKAVVEIATANVENSVYEPEEERTAPKAHKNQYALPKTSLLNKNQETTKIDRMELQQTAMQLEDILKNFGVKAKVTDYSRGPSVTRYEILPEIGTRLNKITTLADDIKLNLAATDIRIEPVAGKSTIGIEIPNKNRESVLIRELIESKELVSHKSKLAFAAGKDIAGKVIVADIAKMPHFLIAGTTGSGKSVFTNSIIMSILYRATPEEVRLIIVDPKVVEFGIYNGIPHLLQPVVTDAKLASNTLKWAVAEMADRYQKFSDVGARSLSAYNQKIAEGQLGEGVEKLPQIVIVIDELADLMMVAAKEVEESICRLAQLARAAGIHLIIATQRPSVDVVTGLIKANIPSRCALMVSSGVDSRTILDSVGAEKLLGNGDMLFYPSGYVKPVRLQGAFVSDAEVERVVDYWKKQCGEAQYDERITTYVETHTESTGMDKDAAGEGERDEYFMDAARLVAEKQKASTSMLQRVFKIGFNRAARMMEQLEEAGIIGEEEGTRPRKVLVTPDELENFFNI